MYADQDARMRPIPRVVQIGSRGLLTAACIAICVVPATAQTAGKAPTMSKATAMRYAATAPLPDASGYLGPDRPAPSALGVGTCKRRTSTAYTCHVDVNYPSSCKPAAPSCVSAPQLTYDVRISYPPGTSGIPRSRVVAGSVRFLS